MFVPAEIPIRLALEDISAGVKPQEREAEYGETAYVMGNSIRN